MLEANVSHVDISRSLLQPFRELVGAGNVEAADECVEDNTVLSLGKVLQHLCDGSDDFRSLLRDTAEKSGLPHTSRQRICI